MLTASYDTTALDFYPSSLCRMRTAGNRIVRNEPGAEYVALDVAVFATLVRQSTSLYVQWQPVGMTIILDLFEKSLA